MSSPLIQIKEFIDTISTSDLEKESLTRMAQVVYFVMSLKSNTNDNSDQIKVLAEEISEIKAAQADLISDQLRVIQSCELMKKIKVEKIEEFNATTKSIIEEPKSEIKLTEMTLKDYFVEKAIDGTFTVKSKDGKVRNLTVLCNLVYKQAKLDVSEGSPYNIKSDATDIEKRIYFSDAFEYIMNNINVLKNAESVHKYVNTQYQEYKKGTK